MYTISSHPSSSVGGSYAPLMLCIMASGRRHFRLAFLRRHSSNGVVITISAFRQSVPATAFSKFSRHTLWVCRSSQTTEFPFLKSSAISSHICNLTDGAFVGLNAPCRLSKQCRTTSCSFAICSDRVVLPLPGMPHKTIRLELKPY